MSRVSRLLVAGALLGALIAAASPVSAARPGSFSFTACWDGDSVSATISWSGFRVDNYAFGQGQFDGSGFAAIEPIDQATNGNVTHDYGINLDDSVDLIGGSVFFHGLRHPVRSDEITRPDGGWAAIDDC